MTVSNAQHHSIPSNYVCFTVPNKEEFHTILANCILVNDGENTHIYVSPEIFATLKQLLQILKTESIY